MSVRREYSVLVGSQIIFSGSYAMCMAVFKAFSNYNKIFPDALTPNITVAFVPHI